MKPAKKMLLIWLGLLIFAIAAFTVRAQEKPKAKPDSTVIIDLRKLDPLIASDNRQLEQLRAKRRLAASDPAKFLSDILQDLDNTIATLQAESNAMSFMKSDTSVRFQPEKPDTVKKK